MATTATAAATSADRFLTIPIDLLRPSPSNPRKYFDPAYITGLAASITEKGVIEPIVVRPHPKQHSENGWHEIVAGECRYLASKAAGLAGIPAVVRDYTDEQVLEVQLIENMHRKNPRAMEQARGFKALIAFDPSRHTAATIAGRVGMSEAWVWDHLKLNDLIAEAQELLDQDRITAKHAIIIARLKRMDQRRVIDPERGGLWQQDRATSLWNEEREGRAPGKWDGIKTVTVRELEEWIREHVRFDVAHAAKAVPLEFAPVAAAVAQAEEQPGRGAKVIPITFSYHVAEDARDPEARTYGSQSWKRADGKEKSKTCEHSVLGVVAAGVDHYGESFQVCVNRDKCRVHFGTVIRAKEKAAKLRESGQGKKAAKVERKAEASWQVEQRKREEDQARWRTLQPHAVAACVRKAKGQKLTNAIARAAVLMLVDRHSGIAALEKALGARVTVKNFARALEVHQILSRQNTREYFAPVAKRYKVDLKLLEKAITPAPAAAAKGAK